MINAPITATRMSPCIARAERRVNIHMNISKLRPRLAKGRVRDLAAILASQCRNDDYIRSNAKDRNKDRPLQPDGLLLVFPQFGPQVKECDAKAIDGME